MNNLVPLLTTNAPFVPGLDHSLPVLSGRPAGDRQLALGLEACPAGFVFDFGFRLIVCPLEASNRQESVDDYMPMQKTMRLVSSCMVSFIGLIFETV